MRGHAMASGSQEYSAGWGEREMRGVGTWAMSAGDPSW
jgi:hypothetical protein